MARQTPQPHKDLLLCAGEASRAAHRERDAAQDAYIAGRHTHAGQHRQKKERWYSLKDRGIVTAHKQGLLRYAGAAPDGMAVYEYGDGGMSCLHSTLHPVGAERVAVDSHPETLFVPAKTKKRGISLIRVQVTLESLPDDTTGYERVAPPTKRRAVTCYECGQEGHIARNCPDSYDYGYGGYDEDDYFARAITA